MDLVDQGFREGLIGHNAHSHAEARQGGLEELQGRCLEGEVGLGEREARRCSGSWVLQDAVEVVQCSVAVQPGPRMGMVRSVGVKQRLSQTGRSCLSVVVVRFRCALAGALN